jgi:hypothetical protein
VATINRTNRSDSKQSDCKLIDIEKLLQWTYRQELPKLQFLGAGLSGRWGNFAMLGTCVSGGRGGTSYGSLDVGPPHPDAGVIHRAVMALDGLEPVLHDGPEVLLSDMPPDVQTLAGDALKRFRVQLSTLVMRFARMGERPDWRAEVPERKLVCSRNGKPSWFVQRSIRHDRIGGGAVEMPYEADGYDPVGKRPLPGAYRKYVYDPDPALIVDLRADYLSWHAALCWLVEELAGKLTSWQPTGPSFSSRPWEDGETRPPRILPVEGFELQSQSVDTKRRMSKKYA